MFDGKLAAFEIVPNAGNLIFDFAQYITDDPPISCSSYVHRFRRKGRTELVIFRINRTQTFENLSYILVPTAVNAARFRMVSSFLTHSPGNCL